tara:strand:- start:1134 stop:1379 length:246 start_codon:yes stop_codon:yes gene_type:complete
VSENIFTDHYLDLRGYACPVNFVKCCLALENLSSNDILKVDIDVGESKASVVDGLQEKGYKVHISHTDCKKVTLIISCEQK